MTELVKALQLFFSGLGIPVYQENSVPKDAVFPYLTYSPVFIPWSNSGMFSARIWDYGGPDFSSKRLLSLIDQLSQKVGEGITINVKTGYIHLTKGSPWVQLQPMQNTSVRVAYINFDIHTLIA